LGSWGFGLFRVLDCLGFRVKGLVFGDSESVANYGLVFNTSKSFETAAISDAQDDLSGDSEPKPARQSAPGRSLFCETNDQKSESQTLNL
jgi:hypothetical protein